MITPPFPPTLAASFAPLDWVVLGAYFVIIAVSGWWFSRKKQNDTTDYFLGGRDMPVWAVICSIVATALSAATFIGAPQITYDGNLSYLATHVTISATIAVLFVGVFFIPVFYANKVNTIYELLELRMGRGAKQAASAMFMIGQVFSSGARLFMVSIPAAMILFNEDKPGNMMLAIAVVTVVGVAYTLAGGIHTVIWTDVIQLSIFVAAAGAALLVLLMRIPADIPTIVEALDASNKLAVDHGATLDQGRYIIDTAKPFTLISSITGLALLNIAAYGTNHDMAQRMLTCRSAAKGRASAILSVLVSVPVQALFLAVGLGLFIFYKQEEVMGSAMVDYQPDGSHKIFLQFILTEMPIGMKGLLLAGLFAAGMGALNSALNAMASTLVSDFYRHIVRDRSPRHYMIIGRLATVFWGLIMGGFAMLCVAIYDPKDQTLISFALEVMVIPYCGMLAVFLTAVFTNRGSSFSAIAALIVGMLISLRLDPAVWTLIAKNVPADAVFDVGNIEVPLKVRFEEMAAWCKQIAFPWRMLIATGPAMVICLLGKRKHVKDEIDPAAGFDAKPRSEGERPQTMRRPI